MCSSDLIVGATATLRTFDWAFVFLGLCVAVGALVIWLVYPHGDVAAGSTHRPVRQPAPVPSGPTGPASGAR